MNIFFSEKEIGQRFPKSTSQNKKDCSHFYEFPVDSVVIPFHARCAWGGDNGGCVTWGGGDGVSATGRAVNWDCVTSNWHRCPVYLDAHVQRNLLLLTSHTSLQVPPCWQGVVAQQRLLQNRSEQSCWGLSYGKYIKNGTLLKRASK